MTIRISKLVDNTVEETQPRFFIELNSNLLEQLYVLLLPLLALYSTIFSLITCLLSDKQHHSVDHRRGRNAFVVLLESLVAHHHIHTDLLDQHWVP